MECREIMNDEVQWILPDQTILQAAKLMEAFHLGWLPVCSDDFRPLGVITDRDIAVRVVAKGRSPLRTRVDEVMTAPAQFVPPDCPIERAAEIMSEADVSRLMILDPQGRLDGVLSLADLLRHDSREGAVATALSLSRRSRAQVDAVEPSVHVP